MNLKNQSFFKIFIVSLISLVSYYQLDAQVYYNVTVTSGSQFVGGTVVGFTPINGHSCESFWVGGSSACNSAPYKLGLGGTALCPNNSSSKFTFNPPVERIRLQIEGLDSMETFPISINGSSYYINPSDISALPCDPGQPVFTAVGGVITRVVPIFYYGSGLVDIYPGYSIDSIRVTKSGLDIAGVEYSLKFAHDTVVYLKQPFIDTALCAGDSVYFNFVASNKFKNTNVFTVQLSNASGSFASPTVIGSRITDTSGVIGCKIPAGTTPGSGYRVRIVSSNPVKTSPDNGKNIVISNITPAAVTANSNGPVCTGSILTLTANSSTSGVTYRWSGPNSYSSNFQNPSITSVTTLAAGNYIVRATLNGCAVKDTVTVVVNTTPSITNVGSNSPACIGGSINLTATSSVSGSTYSWTGPASFTSSLQNPTISGATSANSGTYTVTATANGCTSASVSTTVTATAGPVIFAYPSPNDTICAGRTLLFNTNVIGAGTTPNYQWYKNNIAITGATSKTYSTSSVVSGDVFRCEVVATSGSACNTPISSTAIPIEVMQYAVPLVEITASPDTNAWPGLMITFTATTANAGNTPKYQWKRNGANIIGATASTWSASTLNNNDKITCQITSDYICPSPAIVTSNVLGMHIATAVQGLDNTDVKIFPNPVKEILNIVSAKTGNTYIVYDLLGKACMKGVLSKKENNIDVSSLNPGLYTLSIIDDSSSVKLKFIKL